MYVVWNDASCMTPSSPKNLLTESEVQGLGP